MTQSMYGHLNYYRKAIEETDVDEEQTFGVG